MDDTTPRLQPLTPEAIDALPPDILKDGQIHLDRMPYRIGRESRTVVVKGEPRTLERRKGTGGHNDLYLHDDHQPLQISREHFQLREYHGNYYLDDLGSACGTLVGEDLIGGQDRGGSMPIEHGDVIVVGNRESPYLFQFIVNQNRA